MKQTTQINARIPVDTYLAIKNLGKRLDINFSEALRLVLDKNISEEIKKKERRLPILTRFGIFRKS
jgi:hypothetical protein